MYWGKALQIFSATSTKGLLYSASIFRKLSTGTFIISQNCGRFNPSASLISAIFFPKDIDMVELDQYDCLMVVIDHHIQTYINKF